MSALILSLLIQSYCQSWIISEGMTPQKYKDGFEYYNCINQTTEKDLFNINNLKDGKND